MFSAPIPLISIFFLAAAFLFALLACTYGLLPYFRASKFSKIELPELKSYPKVSVIVYCRCDEDILMRLLESLETQDYPNRETIVVCDAGEDFASLISDSVAERFSNVYVTFVQPGSHNLSRRKLANTIGIKAAKGEVVLTTTADVEIPSDHWLSDMMAPFCGPQGKYIDIVLGATMIDLKELKGAGKWFRQFDEVLANGRWIGYAARGKAFRGDALNMAFRREFFFANKGYAPTNHLHNGDDDVLLRSLANSSNTKVVANPDNILLTHWGDSANRIWRMRKSSYAFTRRWLPLGPFVRTGILELAQWLVPACALVAILVGLPSLWTLIPGCLIPLAMWGIEIYGYRKLAARLGAVRLWWAVIPFMLWHPIADFLFSQVNHSSQKKNYTWER